MVDIVNRPSIYAVGTDVAWLFLVTLSLPGLPSLYLCNNTETFVSRGVAYEPFPFKVILPADDTEQLPRVTLVIANVSSDIIEFIRASENAPDIKIELVTSAYPDLVEKQLNFLKLTNVTYDALQISGQLDVNNFLAQKFPGEGYFPPNFPGLFR